MCHARILKDREMIGEVALQQGILLYNQGQLQRSKAIFLESYRFIKRVDLWATFAFYYSKLLFKLGGYSPELKGMLEKMALVFSDIERELLSGQSQDKIKYDAEKLQIMQIQCTLSLLDTLYQVRHNEANLSESYLDYLVETLQGTHDRLACIG